MVRYVKGQVHTGSPNGASGVHTGSVNMRLWVVILFIIMFFFSMLQFTILAVLQGGRFNFC